MKLRSLLVFAGVISGVSFSPNLGAGEALRIKVLVKLKEKPTEAAKPFADVGGFSMRRNAMEFKGASCPNASNGKGELICNVTCESADADLRLLVLSPSKEKARIVAGLTPPSAISVDIEGCKVTSNIPIVVVYKTASVSMSELGAYAPEVIKAIVADPSESFSIKPFSESANALKLLAENQKNREAILQISRVASAYQDAPPERKLSDYGNFMQYGVGVNSIVLQAVVNDAIGSKSKELVKVSPDAADFYRSVRDVEKELDKKTTLTAPEIQLSGDVRQIVKLGDWKATGDKLQTMGRGSAIVESIRYPTF